MRILLADDEVDARELTEGMLLSAGYSEIVAVASGWEALKTLDVGRTTDEHPAAEIALLDILMPEMDGVELCARIRNDPRYSDMPIIMVSGLSDMDSLANAFVAGATDYVTKPVRRIELVARVRAALRLKQELDRRQARERELLAFLSSWGERRARLWVDEASGLLAGEAIEAYLTSACEHSPDSNKVITVFALTIDRLEALSAANGERARGSVLAQVAGVVNSLAATVGTMAAAYRNGVIILVAPGLGAVTARDFADALHGAVQRLRIPHPESPVSDYVTASVAAITGPVKRDTDGIQLLTRAIASMQEAANAGGNRVLALSQQNATANNGKQIWQNFLFRTQNEVTA